MSQTLPVDVQMIVDGYSRNEIFIKAFLDILATEGIVKCYQSEIVEFLNLDQSNVNRALKSLIKKQQIKIISKGNSRTPTTFKVD